MLYNKGMKKFLIAILITVLAASGAALYARSDIVGKSGGDPIAVTVPEGSGTIQIAGILERSGVIKNAKLFTLWARKTERDGIWQPGSHELAKNCGYEAIAENLSQTAYIPDIKVTIPEGLQIPEIAKILSEAGVCGKEEFIQACAQFEYPESQENTPYPFLTGTDKPGRRKLEGYLFPDTYRFFPDTDPQEIIDRMLRRFGEMVCTKERLDRAAELGKSLDEIVILGSVAESEAVTPEDRRSVAGVFYNRLKTPGYGKLQSCVTVEFALGIHKTIINYSDTLTDSPYNTYMYPGLPIGPICCPSLVSIDAALWPEENDYYFFQSDKYGKLWFASTYGQHLSYQKDVQKDWEVKVRIVGE